MEHAKRASVLIDGENYFRAVRKSMARANKRIMLLGWDFDARIEMHDTTEQHEGPLRIGDYFDWLLKNNRDLNIYILRWNTGAIKSFFRGSSLLTLIRWYFHRRVHFKLDGHHPAGAAHHQKVVAIDEDTAFCSGIDVTNDRWDTRAHEQDQKERKQPDGKDAGPWHDAAMAVQGDVAKALAEFAEQHWHDAGGKKLCDGNSGTDCWPGDLEPDFSDCSMAISRTLPEMDDQKPAREIEQLYLDLIGAAQKYIYAESQYFASAKIAGAISLRLQEVDGPEVIIINPETSDGWLESEIMDSTRARLFEAVKMRDVHDRFRIFHPVNDVGTPIYVHAKILIIDDRIIRVGSSNFNNRSLGFDSECDVTLEASSSSGEATTNSIGRIRNDLISEHLGSTETKVCAKIAETQSLIATIGALRKPGRTLRIYQTPDLTQVQQWLAENDILDPKRADDAFAGII
ncbi:phospholipase D-like domain-containing protein [Parasphingorhabdus halotolerans]|uniref:phospholipase D-like domain-containing protein n=1 Tax=Parasphingorhabdus halotolerans TaxID=2725558 RepID=UPI001FE8FEA1|nr:phospholipase D-like domain-containing protein [Parasphingorhabdus halotolerans]